GCSIDLLINIGLTCLGYIPGECHIGTLAWKCCDINKNHLGIIHAVIVIISH
ncbi:hypothetical protein K492DRAFT_127953, partial [Lichtheimia hyalospora FSU 10163]